MILPTHLNLAQTVAKVCENSVNGAKITVAPQMGNPDYMNFNFFSNLWILPNFFKCPLNFILAFAVQIWTETLGLQSNFTVTEIFNTSESNQCM